MLVSFDLDFVVYFFMVGWLYFFISEEEEGFDCLLFLEWVEFLGGGWWGSLGELLLFLWVFLSLDISVLFYDLVKYMLVVDEYV